MGLSRRMFTKEFKLAAVQRLEQGVSLGEVARALEVNPNVLHRWRREIRQGPGNDVSDAEFDAIFGRIKEAGIPYGSGPMPQDDMKTNTWNGGRGVYFKDPNGHVLELLTRA